MIANIIVILTGILTALYWCPTQYQIVERQSGRFVVRKRSLSTLGWWLQYCSRDRKWELPWDIAVSHANLAQAEHALMAGRKVNRVIQSEWHHER